MQETMLKKQAMSNIVHMLEKEGTFKDAVYVILENMSKYLDITDLAVMQIDEDRKHMETIIYYGKTQTDLILKRSEDIKDWILCADQMLYYRFEDCSETVREFMKKKGIRTSITAPIFINDVITMYVCMFDRERSRFLEQEQLQFIADAAKVIQSIAQEKFTRASLVSAYEVLKEILSSIGSGIMVCDQQNKMILFENDVVKNSGDIRRAMLDCISRYFEKGSEKGTMHKPLEHYDAESGLWFEVKFSDMTWIGNNPVIVCTAMDITQKKKNQQKIEYQAHNDFLTGLYNRMKCENDLRHIIRSADREGKKGAVLFMDLDDFKHINDGLGHQYGDVLLQQVAAGLQSIPGLKGHCYRMGGDEFVIIIPPEIFDIWEKLVKNIVAMFNKPWYLMETEYFCTMSMGVAFFPDDGTEVEDVIKIADIAMYEAKKAGKNQYSIYDNRTSENPVKRLDIENNMRQAVATEIQEFVVFYQPVVDVITGKCVSCEALVRWNSKALGFMGPGDFVPLAEYLGLITSIGDYVLEEACKQCRLWNENGHPEFHINVNLSVVQLLQKDVIRNIAGILAKTGVNPHNIILEITESFAINDMSRVLEIIKGLKKLGPRIALDDFGTGYSSLNYIKQLPLDLIKVDKTFIDDITEDEYAQAFIKLIVELSNTIDTQIVVEGVETEKQYKLLKSLGVNYIQGYFFGKPVPPEEFEENFLKDTQLMKADF